ncbi:actinorhodin polyketide synthase bifunctional cyclase/dehydratase [Streptomyces filipinensis]|uniref:Actinorhodin polyketide synthase bifunctional cyclase/dehydratase n=1 Tax=Streptomyces filipinensis TaxID=66887 RepID=A0A918I9N4_9ACTN|nr:aromatase/cyclase [Streptomyces filipinensis]GGU89486.1 actinorhodin polyketide synthase bifunctional cyclase/dehydratase [Streptomyces filipinensis]
MATTVTSDSPDTAPVTGTHLTEHSITVAAPPQACYALVADVASWPQVFGPTVHVEVQEESRDDAGTGEQLLRIWAIANEQVRTWTSRRTLDPHSRTVTFRQVVPAAPVASMGGTWRIEALEDGTTRVVLLHDYRAVHDDPEAEELIERAVDRNSVAELAALKNAAELGESAAELQFTFSDSVTVAGAAGDVYAFLDRADLWPERLPHVARLALTEDEPGIQHMDMDTRSPDGSLHNTTSVRVCLRDRREIVYKQLRVPVAMRVHTGRWTIEPSGDGETLTVTSWHTVVLDPEGVRSALGPDATLAEARALVRKALGTNSSTTLRHAKQFAEDVHAGT